MATLDHLVVTKTLGDCFADNFAFLPTQETRGGVLPAVHVNAYMITQSFHLEFSMSAELQSTTSLDRWWMTVVYGPQGDSDKFRFLLEPR
jgi:hypothetical protein